MGASADESETGSVTDSFSADSYTHLAKTSLVFRYT